ncbi:MAG: DUF1598 domain-containing protein [Planctomycetota bacterium]
MSHARVISAFAVGCLVAVASLTAGFNNGGGNNVGGVSIDPAGVVRSATIEENQALIDLLRNEAVVPQGDLEEAAELRMVSLSGLQKAIVETRKTGARLAPEVQYMAGLTAIKYVVVDEENNDLILAGPAEPWQLAKDGSVVGKMSGKAVLQLEDLVVALRSVELARAEGISCSIESTDEGRKRLMAFQRRIKLRPGQNPSVFEAGMKQALGPQIIRLNGIPTSSRYACTLVAADYQMKRLAMALVDSPVEGLPSYLQMARNSSHSGNENPRWWMECNYDGLSRNEAGTVWKLDGEGVKTLTEQDLIDRQGKAKASGRSSKLASNWAELMTENFEELATEMPVFGELQNLMDLTVVSTLIVQERLEQRAGFELAVLRDNDVLTPTIFAAPQTIAPECSFIKGRSGWTVTASGGVSISGFQVVQDQKVDPTLNLAVVSNDSNVWWWNQP